jgi:hypothetical protein
MARLTALAVLCTTASALQPHPPLPPRQTPTQVAMMERWEREAKPLSRAATPVLLAKLGSASFRAALAACCPTAAAMPSAQLLAALRAEVRGAELVHNFPAVTDGTAMVEDTSLAAERNASYFMNIWEYAFAVAHDFDVTPAAALIEVNAFGFPPFTGGNATDPGSQPASFAEAQERPIYTALNARAVDAGNPNFGPISAAFAPSYVRNMTFVAPVDTGLWEMICNETHHFGDDDGGGDDDDSNSSSSSSSSSSSRAAPRVGRKLEQRRHRHRYRHLTAQLGQRHFRPFNCSAWAGETYGTLEHLDHVLLASDALWNNASTLLETLNRLFEPLGSGAATRVTGLQAFRYLEADLAGNVLLPAGVKHVLGGARLLGSRQQAHSLREWCVANGWALLWAQGFECLTPAQPQLCYGNRSSDDAIGAGQLRVLDPLVAARLGHGGGGGAAAGRGALNRKLPPNATAAFRSVEWSGCNATDVASDVATPRVAALWAELVGAVPEALLVRAVRAADGCDLDRCVGVDASDAVGEGASCLCYTGRGAGADVRA